MFRIQHKIEGVFVDIDVDSIDYASLQEVREYLKSIRQDDIIYRIFSVPYEKLLQKPKEKVIQKETQIKSIKKETKTNKNKINKNKIKSNIKRVHP